MPRAPWRSDADIAWSLDLGTSNVLIHAREGGLLVREEAVVALTDGQTLRGRGRTPLNFAGRLMATGAQARRLQGRVGPGVAIVHPLSRGMVEDVDLACLMLRDFLARASENRADASHSFRMRGFFRRRRVLISVPWGATSREREAFRQSGDAFGHDVVLVHEPVAAAVGAGLPLLGCRGHLLVDLGSGISEAVLTSLGCVVQGRSLRVGGNDVTKSIQALARREHDFLLPWDEAERIKAAFLDLDAMPGSPLIEARGLCLRGRAPARVFLDPLTLAETAVPFADAIVELVRSALEDALPMLVGDVGETGLWLTGGTSLLSGLRGRLERALGLETRLVPDPLCSVIHGNARLAVDAALREACVIQ